MAEGKAVPSSARIVIIGGGVGGASIAYHLAQRGERDVVLVDRGDLTSGSTFHSAGLVGQLRADPTLTRMNAYSVELYRELGEEVSWVESGGIRLASSTERLQEIRRQISWARSYGLPFEEISPAEAAELFPPMVTDGVHGAAYLPTDGYVDPSQLCQALAARARSMGVRIHTHVRVLGIDLEAGRIARVRTDAGDIACETVINCGGMFAAEIARLVDVRVPIVPMSHQYLVTEPCLPPRDRPLPTLRDPDLLVYYRQEVDGLVMGGYERDSAPWTATATSYDAIPADFNGRLLPEDWERFTEITENSGRRVPLMGDVGIRKLVNGPEAFTPDNEFCLGETEVPGFFVAAGFCAHGIAGAGGIGRVMAEWIVDGEPGMDVWHMDIRRFGRHWRSPAYTLARTVENYESYYDIGYPHQQRSAGRPLRTSPIYAWHREQDAFFGEKAGWERVDYYRSNEAAGDPALRPDGWPGRHWSPAIGAEHLGTRAAAGLFDESSFAKIEVSGPDAAELMEWVCANRVARGVGRITYTQALNQRGGIECDFTVTRLEEQRFRVVTGTAFGPHDLGWLRKQARLRGADVRIADVTGQYACFALWGPAARDILTQVTSADLGNTAHPFMAARELTVGDVPTLALRVTFVGELGWELYCSSEFAFALWRTLVAAGAGSGLVLGGYRAIDSLRLEKGYRVWGADITPETTPYEAGLGFCVKPDKPGGFCGLDALLAAGEPTRTLVPLLLDDPRTVVLGSEPVRATDDTVIGRVTSGGYGYTVGASIAYAYLPTAYAVEGTRVTLDVFGRTVGGAVAADPLFDPKATRVRVDAPARS